MTRSDGPADDVRESVMAGGGYYSRHSRPQHVAAAPGYPLLERAATAVPLGSREPAVVGDFGCAGGANEMEPVALAIDTLRRRSPAVAVQVVHTDLPENDFSSLFGLLGSEKSYLDGRPNVFSLVAGATLYGPLLPDRSLTLGWTAITVHWLSSVPCPTGAIVYSNLATGNVRAALQEQSRRDWDRFLAERARELRDGGEVVVVGGASRQDGSSGAEGLFEMITSVLDEMVDDGTLRDAERNAIFYPTWNRTLDEFVAPFSDRSGHGAALELREAREDSIDDGDSFPQFRRDGEAAAFADAYISFVRAVTARSFFRWLDPDRREGQRREVEDDFYRRLQQHIGADPEAATCRWHTVSLRFGRRPR
jgi:hypothetical protein